MSVNKKHFQDFMKRYRDKYKTPMRYFHCGEYGAKLGRPHYHALIFNHDFADKRLHQRKNENDYFISEQLSKLWPWGFSLLGAATFQSAGYVARYIMKKRTGRDTKSHYEYVNPENGEVTIREPEYITMSRRPGLGDDWIKKYWRDVYPDDFVVINNKKYRPPVYYDRWLEENEPRLYRNLKAKRIKRAKEHPEDSTAERLAVREFIKESRTQQLVRELE